MSAKELPSAEYVRSRLDYYLETGIFIWRQKPGTDRQTKAWNAKYAGKPAGSIQKGYVLICLDNVKYYAHRLAYLIMTGEQPVGEIDHKDSDPKDISKRSDNRWENLRLATSSKQKCNIGLRKDNTSGYRGVWWHKQCQKWCAEIRYEGVSYKLGLFLTEEEAYAAYCLKAAELHGDYRHAVVAASSFPDIAPIPSTHKLGSSGVRGVRQDVRTGRWVAEISINSKNVYLGTFDTKEEAIECRRKAELGLAREVAARVPASGAKNICARGNRFQAFAVKNGKRYYIGTYDTVAQAVAAQELAMRDDPDTFKDAAD